MINPKLRQIPKPIIDVNTSNISFLQVSNDLKNLGIKNNKFFLALYDKKLVGVDPFDYAKLTPELIQRITVECIINPWYFKREIARIPDQGGKPIQFELNRGNLAASYCFHKHIDHYLVLPRQVGKTKSELSDVLWAFLFGTNKADFAFSHYEQDGASINLRDLKSQRDCLPEYLQYKIAIGRDAKLEKGIDNVRSLKCAVNENTIHTMSKATSKDAADRIGRGKSYSMLFYDEVDFCAYIDTIVRAMAPAYSNTAQRAKANNSAHCRIFTSTPGDVDSPAGMCALKIIDGCCQWDEKKFYDEFEDVEEYIKINSNNGIVYIEYQYTALGKDEEWFILRCNDLGNDPMAIKRELLLKRMRGNAKSPYEPQLLDDIQDRLKPIKYSFFINKIFKVDMYDDIDPNIGYIIGVDVASGVNNDSTAITILNPHTCKPIGEFKSPHISLPQQREFFRQLIIRYFSKSILVIERNNTGIALIQMLLETDIASRLYFDKTNVHKLGTTRKVDKDGYKKSNVINDTDYGVWTGPESREIMFNLLETHILDHRDRFGCKMLVDDIFKLIRNSRGKILADPAGDGHDDNVMSYLIALYVYYYGKNLVRFGISKSSIDSIIEDNLEEAREKDKNEYELLQKAGIEGFNDNHRDYQAESDAQRMKELAAMRELLSDMYSDVSKTENLDTYTDYNGGIKHLSDDLFYDSDDFNQNYDPDNFF